jgi:UDP-N-acetylglucosamine 2-epimerase (non-hydrolysing)
MKKLLIAFGTRPEIIKLKPLIRELKKRNNLEIKLLYVGQHSYTTKDVCEMLDLFPATIETLKIETNVACGRLDSIVVGVLSECADKCVFEGVHATLVQGDTTSAFAVALASFHAAVPVLHLEAGMRSEDNHEPFPEEFNRRSISVISSLHLCPTPVQASNLLGERVNGEKYVVGNTVCDDICQILSEEKEYWQNYSEKCVIITLHRRENRKSFPEWFQAIETLASSPGCQHNFLFIIHNSPEVRQHLHIFKNVRTCEPLERNQFIHLLNKCERVITDSGGVQEEAVFLNKKVLLCRKSASSERCEDENTIFVENPKELEEKWNLANNLLLSHRPYNCVYGDGQSSPKCAIIIEKFLNSF